MTEKHLSKGIVQKGAFDLIIVIPFYNEAKRLPSLLNSLYVSANKFNLKYYLIMVNHNGSDNSISIIDNFKDSFYRISIVLEDFPIHCGGIPRSKGFAEAIKLVGSLDNNKNIPIATVDADVVVSPYFGIETINKLKFGYDIVIFCERYDQKELFDFIFSYSLNRKFALRSFIGLNWFRYQILWTLILSGIKETRGSGYAMFSQTLQELKHLQPFDSEGKPITGENNRLGIIANSKGLTVYASPYYSKLHPRRELESCLNVETKGYVKNKDNSEIFKLSREKDRYQKLKENQLTQYLDKGILRTIRMLLIRIIAYQKFEASKNWFNNEIWLEILVFTKKYVDIANPDLGTLSVVGNGKYEDMFNFVINEIGPVKTNSFVKYLQKKIPNNQTLIRWAQNKSDIIKPSNYLISELISKFAKEYH